MQEDADGAARNGPDALSGREKEVLRLLLAGHDAKSSACELGLSVHTINEHLREARRKLGTSSSREAARLLGEAERTPDSLGTEQLRVADRASALSNGGAPDRRPGVGHSVLWFGGGMLIMSLVIAAAALSTLFHAGGAAQAPAPLAMRAVPGEAESAPAARAWLALVDRQAWDASWEAAGALFKAQMAKPAWASAVEAARAPYGALKTRVFQSVSKSNSLPGAPAGDYEVLQFQTSFAQKPDAAETVILARESAGWKVIGYFVR